MSKIQGSKKKTENLSSKKQIVCKPSTAELKAAFLERLRESGRVDLAARAVGIHPSLPHVWQRDDPEFKEAREQAKKSQAQLLIDEGMRRARKGVAKPVYQGGKKVGSVVEYSDTLLIFLLKGLEPETYRDRYDIKSDNKHQLSGEVTVYKIPDNGRDK